MAWQWIAHTILPLMAAVISIITALYILWRRRHRPASRTGALVLLACAELSGAYILEVGSASLPAKVFWTKMEYMGLVIAPTAWLVYTLQYTGRENRLTRRTLALVSIVPLIFAVLIFTNETHGLIWRRIWLDTDGPFSVAGKTYGVGFWVFVGYSYMLMLLATFLHIQMFIRSRYLYRWQASVLVFATVLPWLGNMLDVFKLSPFPKFVSTSLGLVVGGLTVALTIYRVRRGDILSVSRGAIVGSMSDGVIVLDAENRIVDLNPAAQHLIGHAASEAIGQLVEQVWSDWPGQIEGPRDMAEVAEEVALGQGDEQCIYDVRIFPLVDWRGHLVSRVVALRDITEFKRRTVELSTVLEATRALSSTLDLKEVLVLIAERMVKAVRVDGCTLSHWDQEADAVVTWIEWRRQDLEWIEEPGTAYALDDFPATRVVLETRQPLIMRVSDPDADPAEVAYMQKVESASLLMLPLVVGDQVIGLAELDQSEYERGFTAAEIHLCQALADQAAVAIENARLFEETRKHVTHLKRKTRDMELVHQISRMISSLLDLTHILETTVEQMVTVFEADHSGILLFDEAQLYGQVVAECPSTGATTERFLVEGYLAAERIIADRAPLMIEDVWNDPLMAVVREVMHRLDIRSMLIVPLIVKGKVIGSIGLDAVGRQRRFNAEEVALAQTIANQVAIAIENAQLHDETQRRLQEQTALREAGAVISSTLDLETVLTRIAEQMGRAVDTTSAYICGFEPETMTSTVLAEYIGPQACSQEHVSDLGVTYVEDEIEIEIEFLETMQVGQSDISHIDAPDLPESERAHMQQYGAQTILYVPLQIKGQLLGFAELWESRRRREFTSEEIALCQGISQQAAIALENARLYEQAQQEIAERRRAKEQIQASLREKEVLLKEIHHRVKNNLQVISSLLYLQSKNIGGEGAFEMFQESQNRVRAMALVHERLYQSQDLARVDFAEYIRGLTTYLFRSYNVSSSLIKLAMEVEHVPLGIDTAIPCGLILNELISNSLKYAFPDNREGEILIKLCSNNEGQCTLMVRDNGVGFPKGLDFRNTESLGLQLVNTLVDQLEGTIELDRSDGTAFGITFAERP